MRAILEAAEKVLAEDPGAPMEQIAEAAGLARTTVHRRFANRQALIEALAASAKQQLTDARDPQCGVVCRGLGGGKGFCGVQSAATTRRSVPGAMRSMAGMTFV